MPPKKGASPDPKKKAPAKAEAKAKGGKSLKANPASPAQLSSQSSFIAKRKEADADAGPILKLFQKADVDGNGEICVDELFAVFGGGMTREQVQTLVIASDADKDGVLDYTEFIHWIFSDVGLAEHALMGSSNSANRAATPTADNPRKVVHSDSEDDEDSKSLKRHKKNMEKEKKEALTRYPSFKEPVTAYYKEIKERLKSKDFDEKVKEYFVAYDTDQKGGVVSYEEVAGLIRVALEAINDVWRLEPPSEQQVRAFFDAYDTGSYGKGEMGEDEFLVFMQALHFKVHSDLLPKRVAEWRKQEKWKKLAADVQAEEAEESAAAVEERATHF